MGSQGRQGQGREGALWVEGIWEEAPGERKGTEGWQRGMGVSEEELSIWERKGALGGGSQPPGKRRGLPV